MKKIGLALSGGGFRASLYHLGVVRFLRDAGILPQVTHITSVSGGSILAAHLLLNWQRYNGSPDEFDAAASEFLAFVRLDVRNRITRRFPLYIPVRWLRRLLGLSNRKLTRTGLLEAHYERYLYGDTSLFELPEKPQLHILATNLSEGCLCSFSRNGLLMMRRHRGHTMRVDRIHVGLASVPMAVTASSAFPGFFPPLELTGWDVGADVGEFGRQAFTDGGVFDNLGVRMFGHLERSLLVESPLSRDDFVDYPAVVQALGEAGKSNEETPLRRLTQVLSTAGAAAGNAPARDGTVPEGDQRTLAALWDVLRNCQFQRDPLFAGLKLADAEAAALLDDGRLAPRSLDAGNQVWLNRHLVDAAFRQATGRACFRRLNSALDGVLVSDVGKRIAVTGNRRAGGLIRTALRATDILMDRVWQLETETFQGTPGFVFAPITELVGPSEDATALHPEIQRQAAKIRTDLDGFSPLEVSSLVRHGYCVARKACRARPDLFGAELPGGAPWDPLPQSHDEAPRTALTSHADEPHRDATETTADARALQASALRRILGTLLDRRDWVSYIYVPLLATIVVTTPYLVVKSYQQSQRLNKLVKSFSQSGRDLEQISRLLEYGPATPWSGAVAEEVGELDVPDFTGFEILQDLCITDLRKWQPRASERKASSIIHQYRRIKVVKLPEHKSGDVFRLRLPQRDPKAGCRFPPQELRPRLR
ncbi:MAG TPA: patatin-like phospholipase family protein, partial [Pirellulales bacterium]|nr:patatin-like phospholipase family protein [Pirellulales bacterium]